MKRKTHAKAKLEARRSPRGARQAVPGQAREELRVPNVPEGQTGSVSGTDAGDGVRAWAHYRGRDGAGEGPLEAAGQPPGEESSAAGAGAEHRSGDAGGEPKTLIETLQALARVQAETLRAEASEWVKISAALKQVAILHQDREDQPQHPIAPKPARPVGTWDVIVEDPRPKLFPGVRWSTNVGAASTHVLRPPAAKRSRTLCGVLVPETSTAHYTIERHDVSLNEVTCAVCYLEIKSSPPAEPAPVPSAVDPGPPVWGVSWRNSKGATPSHLFAPDRKHTLCGKQVPIPCTQHWIAQSRVSCSVCANLVGAHRG